MKTLIPLGVSAPRVAQLRNSLWWSHPNPVPVTLKVQQKAHQLPEFVPEDSSPPDGPGLSVIFLIMNRSCWVDSFYNGCMPEAVVFKSGSSRCFQGHQMSVGWGKAQLSTGVAGHASLELLCWALSHMDILNKLWRKFCCFKRLQRVLRNWAKSKNSRILMHDFFLLINKYKRYGLILQIPTRYQVLCWAWTVQIWIKHSLPPQGAPLAYASVDLCKGISESCCD